MKTLFFDNLIKTHKGIKEQRANLLNRRMIAAQDDLISKIEKKKDDIEFSLLEMEDFGPSSSFDLKTPDIDAEKWTTNYQSLLVNKRILDIEYEIAIETKAKWFSTKQKGTENE
jgi:hypothetical protein